MAACIALLRGINVGRTKRIAMADLRTLLETLGYSDVRTLLNSGNAVFQATRPNPGKISAAIETAIQAHFGFSAPVIVLTAPELDAVIAENALPQAVRGPSKFLVAFASTAASLARFRPLLEKSWAPDVLAVGPRAAYLWCANGIAESKLALEFMRATADTITTRNWATVLKLQAAACTRPHAA
jgi:uncharacterized protein (DUF1697 family)